jgi:light-regulated signal transduction histidine kinase (bacteriophytochrome)
MVAANEELEAFAYSVSHDLRAPLRGMDAFSRILLEKHARELGQQARHCLQMIRDNARQMGGLIDALLEFSRSSRQALTKERVDQQALVRSVIESLETERQGRRIDLTVGELPSAEADPRLLRQVWVNLIANAYKYTRGRDPAVIRVGAQNGQGAPVYFVQDNGVGFDMRYAAKLFKVFQRLHRPEDFEGTGIGLATVHRIIARHGGRIWTQAEKDAGAAFYYTLQAMPEGGKSSVQ